MATTDIAVVGLNKAIRQLQAFGVGVQDLKTAFKKIATNVQTEAQSRVNTRSGDLAASIRSANSKNKAIVRAGSARVPYAGVINYGGYNHITAQEFLTGAARDKQGESIALIEGEIRALTHRYNIQ